jgi:hypothetical protein
MLLPATTLVRDTAIESVTACQTARTPSPNLLSPNLVVAWRAKVVAEGSLSEVYAALAKM